MKNFILIVCLLISTNVVSAQDVVPDTQPTVQSNPATVLILVNESQPNQMIIYDGAGTWLSTIREIKLNIDLLGSGVTAECTMWKGVLKPENPKQFTAQVKEIKSINAELFTKRLAKLNEE